MPFFLLACGTEGESYERPMDPWAFRSVLDKKPRMLTLALHPDCYVAYDLEKSELYKVWKGGVRLEGTVFTNKKNIQPTSWGNSYFEDGELPRVWKLYSSSNEPIDFSIVQKGYTFAKGQITLHFELNTSEGVQIRIDETPEFIPGQGMPPVFERIFTVQGLKPGMKLSLSEGADSFELSADGRHPLRTELPVLPFVEMPPLKAQYDHLGILRMEGSDCFTCHEEHNRMVGPSFEEIAHKYEGDKSVYPYLSQKIREGGSGVWGDTPMNPHPQLSDADIKPMLDYIMTFAPKESKPASAPVRVVAPKAPVESVTQPGFGAPLEGVHPSFDLVTLHRDDFQPRVAGLAIAPDGGLLVSTWDSVGGVYHLTWPENVGPADYSIKRIAEGLAEPLGLEVVGGDLYVLQKHELTRLRDLDGDGVMDEYFPICNSWGVTDDFHEFAFGLVFKEGYFYATLSMAMRLATGVQQAKDRGKTLKIALDGTYETLDYGLRTPNGIGIGPDGELFVADNQGQWLPANKLIHVQPGAFNGMAWGLSPDLATVPEMVPPAIWLPDKEIGNSPTEPILMKHGPYAGQMIHGDVTHGGIKRDFLEKINGSYQGAVFRFSQGFHAGVNRLVWGPGEALYVGEVGMVGGWSWKERQFGLEKLTYNGKPTFEMLAIRAKPEGFEIEFTEPLKDSPVEIGQIKLAHWWYLPTESYGGPKMDLQTLRPSRIDLSPDRRRAYLEVPDLIPGRVVYFSLDPDLKSESGRTLWSGEAWYTLNAIPVN
ncbi:c-type cytochrome [Lunatimonas salinarum]|uniref:c-type cytochrome n=1 Tax=Lunatimonas salinarum TaxID=1774590 RepID=UPI001ADF7CDF|nr:c-type cytochrome [Lunatimonas salinarum]